MLDYITYTNYSQLSYEIHAELAVLYATKVDETYRKQYFAKVKDHFLKELKHLKGETMYKIVWSLMRADELKIEKENFEWQQIKKIIIKRAKDLDTKLLTDILVMATKEKSEGAFIGEDMKEDLFTQIEPTLIVKMSKMTLDELLNVLWAVVEVNRGTPLLYETIEEELTKRIRLIKDE